MNLTPRNVHTRLTLFFAISLGLILCIVFFLLYKKFEETQQSTFDASLYNYAEDISQNLKLNLFGEITLDRSVLKGQRKILPFSAGESFLQIHGQRGNVLVRSTLLGDQEIPLNKTELAIAKQGQVLFKTRILSKSEYRVILFPVISPGAPIRLLLQVAVPTHLLQKQRKQMIRYFLFLAPFLLLILVVVGYSFSSAALSPISKIIAKAKNIEASDLSQRIPVSPVKDELQTLSLTLNGLLDRIEKAFASQDEFVANASHQIKTPLAILKGEIDVLRMKPRSVEEYEEFAEEASHELSHLSEVIDDLLLLAKMEVGKGTFKFEQVQLDEVLSDAIRWSSELVSAKGIKIRFDLLGGEDQESPGYVIDGNPHLLISMFQALLENAIKHSFENQVIKVTLENIKGVLRASILNFGKPIPEDQYHKIFQRFYQSDTSSPALSGYGLGLAIAQQIARIHGGLITVKSSEELGTEFTLEIKNF